MLEETFVTLNVHVFFRAFEQLKDYDYQGSLLKVSHRNYSKIPDNLVLYDSYSLKI